jgi:hypothetical protein
MKTTTQLNLNALIFYLYYCNYIYTTLQEKKLQNSVYCPSGVPGVDSLGADSSSTSSSAARDIGEL